MKEAEPSKNSNKNNKMRKRELSEKLTGRKNATAGEMIAAINRAHGITEETEPLESFLLNLDRQISDLENRFLSSKKNSTKEAFILQRRIRDDISTLKRVERKGMSDVFSKGTQENQENLTELLGRLAFLKSKLAQLLGEKK